MLKSCISSRNFQILFKNLQRRISETTNKELHQNISNDIKWMRLNTTNNARVLSTVQPAPRPKTLNVASKDEINEFLAVFPDIVRDLTSAGQDTSIPEVDEHYASVIHFSVPNGKLFRALSLLTSYKLLEKPENLTPENIRRAIILGWCIEILQGSFTITDDIVDNSEYRRGAPCWHRLVGDMAVNDVLLVINSLYVILKKYFSNHHCYVPTLELFHDITLKTVKGEALDSMFMKDGRPNFEMFTMNKFTLLSLHKTGYYTFELPISLSMYLANIYDPEMHRQAKTILMEMALFYQIQDDYLDCFGNPEKTGKRGNDTREGKCTWLAVTALQRANPQQRKIMDEYYGRDDPEAVKIITHLYEELDLPKLYAIYEEESFNNIRTQIEQSSKNLPHQVFYRMVQALYKREW